MSNLLHTFIAAFVFFGSASFIIGCDDVTALGSSSSVRVSADDLDRLQADEVYVLSVKGDVSYQLDPSAGPLDLSKVMLVRADGETLSLKDAIVTAPEFEGLDTEALSGAAMTISATEDSSGEITPRQAEAEVQAGCVSGYVFGIFIMICW